MAIYSTLCTPISKAEPGATFDDGKMVTLELSVTVGGSQFAMPVAWFVVVQMTRLAGQMITGFS